MTASEIGQKPRFMEASMKNKLKTIGSLYRTGLSKLSDAKDHLKNKTSGLISIISKPPQTVKNAPIRTK